MEKEWKYTAFISYNSKDNRTARWLQKRLENYSLPSIIANEKGEVLKSYDKTQNKFRVFRYVTDLVAQNLEDGLRRELDQSKFLIVICSPNSANAPWVRKEVNHFIAAGKKKQIIPFVIDGVPYSGDQDECFTPELKDAFPNGELLGVSLKDNGDDLCIFRKLKAVAKMVSLLIDLPDAYDFIWNRYRLRYIEQQIIRAVFFLIVAISIGVVKHMAEPFKMCVSIVEEDINHNLPEIRDVEIAISLDGNKTLKDTIASLNDKAIFGPIEKRMIGKPMRLILRNATCYCIDTIVSVQQNFNITLHRNPDIYGKINILVMKDGERLQEQCVVVEGICYKTNDYGVLQLQIPLASQKQSYSIKYGEYSNIIHMPCMGTNCVEFKTITE